MMFYVTSIPYLARRMRHDTGVRRENFLHSIFESLAAFVEREIHDAESSGDRLNVIG
jgi:hypothetical protein